VFDVLRSVSYAPLRRWAQISRMRFEINFLALGDILRDRRGAAIFVGIR